ncbi:SCO4402 family protein [Amycolatopsis plumensis]|uniref:SCO4402 family protein n=1 Tax=Amycolatopsis plumensis TaxID=236508 RepID=UPI003A905249
MNVAWPERREDVISALGVVSAEPPTLDGAGRDTRFPDITNAVHWLVDDTSWDSEDPAASIGTILRNSVEAGAIRAVVAAVVGVSDRQGAAATDREPRCPCSWPGEGGHSGRNDDRVRAVTQC